jgi:hypothetical protein
MSVDAARLEYDQTLQLVRTLIDVRFKLLAFVPTIAGFGVGLFGKPRPAVELLAVGLIGLVATLGIFIYELRNSQTYAAAVRRAAELEQALGMPGGPGSLLRERRGRTARLFGLLAAWQERGLALVYGAAISGWTYLFAWGVLRALDVGNARNRGLEISIVIGILIIADVELIDRRAASDDQRQLASIHSAERSATAAMVSDGLAPTGPGSTDPSATERPG